MRLLHAISSVDPAAGGVIESVKQLGNAHMASGHIVEIASLDDPDAACVKSCPIPVHALGPSRPGYSYSKRFVPWLREKRNSYDAVIVNGIWQFHSFGTWQALRSSSTPYFLFTHGMLDPWFKQRYPLKHLKKNLYWPWAEYRVLRDARGVLFTCEEERRLARESFRRYAAREMVVSLGISRPAGEPVAEIREFFAAYPKLKDKRIALFMGRIHPKKGCDLLIEAFYKVLKLDPRWHLVFAGPDQVGWAKKLQARAGQLRIDDRLTWTGMLTGAVKWGCFRASEIFVLPSHQENFGVVVAEALAVGVPALISNKVNIWREVQADGAGIVADDSVDGAEELLRVYAGMSTECGALMRERARYCFERRFEIGKVAGAIGSLLSNAAHLN